jgi:hypothetical protein
VLQNISVLTNFYVPKSFFKQTFFYRICHKTPYSIHGLSTRFNDDKKCEYWIMSYLQSHFQGYQERSVKKVYLGSNQNSSPARLWQYNFKTLLEKSETKLKIVRRPATFYPTLRFSLNMFPVKDWSNTYTTNNERDFSHLPRMSLMMWTKTYLLLLHVPDLVDQVG